MIKNKVITDLKETVSDSLNLCIKAEEQDPDFILLREYLEQALDELESLEE